MTELVLVVVILALLAERAVAARRTSRERDRLVILATQGTSPVEKALQIKALESGTVSPPAEDKPQLIGM